MNTKKRSQTYVMKLLAMILCDVLLVNAAYFGSLWIRYDLRLSAIPHVIFSHMLVWAPLFTVLSIIIFSLFRIYRSIWAYAGTHEFIQLFFADFLAVALQFCLMRGLINGPRVPNGCYFIQLILLFIGMSAVRIVQRFYFIFERLTSRKPETEVTKKIPTMIIGAGEAGRSIIHEFRVSDKLENEVLALIDDDPDKKGRYLEGVRIYGGREDILSTVRELGIEEIILAIPSASVSKQQEILNYCKQTSCNLKILPGMYQIITGEVNVSKLRDVNLEDLLGREPIEVNMYQIAEDVRDKVILVTGGGGTIGSELCRQLATFHPKKLIIFDIYENNAYEIQMELQREHPELNLLVLIGSVRNKDRLRSIFAEEHPDIVYHAAAHKHVPLMEVSPNEAIKNNVFGTLNTARCADEYHVKRFVLISTDKAVNPTNVMGATKRLCEMIIQMMSRRSKTDFVAVRFGNVLGSNGSVIPLFKKQIEKGGPITVTHPDIVRFFMTIPEAVSLVLQAGAFAQGGEIFVLDMGKPVKIDDMAKNLVRLSGLTLGEDIEIVYTGLRPGEKLYEEVLMDEEGLQRTENRRIRIGEPIDMDDSLFERQLPLLYRVAYRETDHIRDYLAELVPTFQESVDGIPHNYREVHKKDAGYLAAKSETRDFITETEKEPQKRESKENRI